MANSARSKSGTFVGDGTKAVDLQVGFEPDVIVIDSGIYAGTAGNTGLYMVAIAKNVFSVNYSHNSDTDTQIRGMAGSLSPNLGWSDSSLGAYRSRAEYSNGVLTVTNATNAPGAQYCFITGQTYTWTAYKA